MVMRVADIGGREILETHVLYYWWATCHGPIIMGLAMQPGHIISAQYLSTFCSPIGVLLLQWTLHLLRYYEYCYRAWFSSSRASFSMLRAPETIHSP